MYVCMCVCVCILLKVYFRLKPIKYWIFTPLLLLLLLLLLPLLLLDNNNNMEHENDGYTNCNCCTLNNP